MFDTIICNPPYSGGEKLHQNFFVKSYSHLNKNGIQLFIHPATPYQNNKTLTGPDKEVAEIVSKNETTMTFHKYDVFGGNANGMTDIAIVCLRKNSNPKLSFTYRNGRKYQSTIDTINVIEMDPDIFLSLKSKYQKILKKGNLKDIIGGNEGAYIQSVRGNIYKWDFFTIVSSSIKYHKEYDGKSGQCVQVPKHQFKTFYAYASSFIARMGLALSKYNSNNHSGELKTVPLPDFSVNRTPQEWDEFMKGELNITDEEWKEIRRVLPDYHDLGEY